jgi:hypothetical protein
MSRLSLADIDGLARLQRRIMRCSVLIDQLLEREKFQGKPDEPSGGNVGRATTREALAGLLDDITEAARAMESIVNRDDEAG